MAKFLVIVIGWHIQRVYILSCFCTMAVTLDRHSDFGFYFTSKYVLSDVNLDFFCSSSNLSIKWGKVDHTHTVLIGSVMIVTTLPAWTWLSTSAKCQIRFLPYPYTAFLDFNSKVFREAMDSCWICHAEWSQLAAVVITSHSDLSFQTSEQMEQVLLPL